MGLPHQGIARQFTQVEVFVTRERLQKIMAHAGIASRRACEELIAQGRVRVNGEVATLGMSADPQEDDIRLDGERIRSPQSLEYLLLNKPRGVISDEDVGGQHANARDLIPLPGYLYPVGRLDLNSEGLMLFTNDGELAHRLTHPRYDHPKTYHVLLEGSVSEEALIPWRRGMTIEGRRTRPAEVRVLRRMRDGTLVEVTLLEGRKRQIRRMAALIGHPVLSLIRIRLGPLVLGDLPPGGWRRLTEEEVRLLRSVREQPSARPRRAASLPGGRQPQPASPSGSRSRRPARSPRDGEAGRSGRRRPAGADVVRAPSGASSDRPHAAGGSAKPRRQQGAGQESDAGRSRQPRPAGTAGGGARRSGAQRPVAGPRRGGPPRERKPRQKKTDR